MTEEDEPKERTSGERRGEGEAREGEEALEGRPEGVSDDARTRASHALETLEVRLAILACDAMVAADLDGYIPFFSTVWAPTLLLRPPPLLLLLVVLLLVPADSASAAASSCAAMVARNSRITFLDSLTLARASSRSARTVS